MVHVRTRCWPRGHTFRFVKYSFSFLCPSSQRIFAFWDLQADLLLAFAGLPRRQRWEVWLASWRPTRPPISPARTFWWRAAWTLGSDWFGGINGCLQLASYMVLCIWFVEGHECYSVWEPASRWESYTWIRVFLQTWSCESNIFGPFNGICAVLGWTLTVTMLGIYSFWNFSN